MDIRPEKGKLLWRDLLTLFTITLIIIFAFLIIQFLVVWNDPDINHSDFVNDVWIWVTGVLVAAWIFIPWFIWFWILNLRYVIDEERLVIHKGIIVKKSVSVPYSAITDFTLSRSYFERKLEIATLMVQTAGQSTQAGGFEAKLEGLVDFEALHRVLRERVKSNRSSGSVEKSTEDLRGDSQLLQAILEELRQLNAKVK